MALPPRTLPGSWTIPVTPGLSLRAVGGGAALGLGLGLGRGAQPWHQERQLAARNFDKAHNILAIDRNPTTEAERNWAEFRLQAGAVGTPIQPPEG